MFAAEPIEVQHPGDYEYFLALQQDYVQMPRQQLGLRNQRLEYLALAHEEIGIAIGSRRAPSARAEEDDSLRGK